MGEATLLGGVRVGAVALVERIRAGAPLAVPDPSTFYGGGARGYTDYPAWRP